MRHLKFFSFGFLAALTLGGFEHMRSAASVPTPAVVSMPAAVALKPAPIEKN